jgi:hypothetical protein
MKFSRMLKVVAVLVVMGLLAGNADATTIYASGDAPQKTKSSTVKKQHKHHKHHKQVASTGSTKHHKHSTHAKTA